MSTDYRVEMQQEEKLREITEKQVDALVKVGIPEGDAYEMLEAWHLKNGYPFVTTDLKVHDVVKLWEEQTGRTIPLDIVDAMKFLQWEGRNGGTRAFKDRSIIQVLRYFIKYYEEK